MNQELHIQKFIKDNPSNWEQRLQEKPYCISISRSIWNSLNLIMFKYSQIDSDFNESICRECRGLILNEDTLDVISYPFQKFGNFSEGTWVEKIDWNNHPYVLEKCDGSLIKVVKVNGNLLISTNGTILASTAPLVEQIGCPAKNFEDLFYYALKYQFKDFSDEWFSSLFEEGYTYMFELCTIFNRVVVPHKEPKTYFIGIRNNISYNESFIYDHPLSKIFPTPKMYEFDTFEHCIETAKALPWDSEGYVITSRDFKRNKAKSLGYLATHHLKNNGVMSYERAIELIRLNEVDEVLGYFPEFKSALTEVREKYNELISSLEVSWAAYKLGERTIGFETRKDSAIWIQKNFKIAGVGFTLIDKKVSSVKEWIENCPAKNLVKYLGFKD